MPGPQNTMLIEGTFRELAEELADYVDQIRKSQDSATSLRSRINPLVEEVTKTEEKGADADEEAVDEAKDAVLDALVEGSSALNQAPEKELTAAYNLLIHLIKESDEVNKYLQTICRQLSNPDNVSTSPSAVTRASLALSTLSTIFNILESDNTVRYPVFSAILDVVARSSAFESIRPQLKHLDDWLVIWKASPTQSRKLLLKVSTIAKDASDAHVSYEYLLRALRTIPPAEASSEEAKSLSLDALKAALSSPTHYDFEDLTALDSVQVLRQSAPIYYSLLETFTSDTYDDFLAFKEEHSSFISDEGLDDDILTRKIRLLTVASLGASAAQTRTLLYKTVEEALHIPAGDVEIWLIDVIRAGLVEGKLSQLRKEFLVHRSTYRVFGNRQWHEVAGRLDMWRESLRGVLEVVRREKEEMILQKEAELRNMESKMGGSSFQSNGYRRPREPVEQGLDGIGA